jgi:hypothetical protein
MRHGYFTLREECTNRLTVFENNVLRRICGSKQDEIGRAYRIHQRCEKCIQHFSWKRPLGMPRHIGRIMLQWILQNKDVRLTQFIKCG